MRFGETRKRHERAGEDAGAVLDAGLGGESEGAGKVQSGQR